MGENLVKALDHVTDVTGIAAITVLALNGAASPTNIAAIVSIALGQRYAKGKWLNGGAEAK